MTRLEVVWDLPLFVGLRLQHAILTRHGQADKLGNPTLDAATARFEALARQARARKAQDQKPKPDTP